MFLFQTDSLILQSLEDNFEMRGIEKVVLKSGKASVATKSGRLGVTYPKIHTQNKIK